MILQFKKIFNKLIKNYYKFFKKSTHNISLKIFLQDETLLEKQ